MSRHTAGDRRDSPQRLSETRRPLRSRLSVNGLTTVRWNLLEDISGRCDAGFETVGLWRPKVLEFGDDRAVELLQDSPLRVSSLSWIGGFTGNNGQTLTEAIQEAQETLQLAARLEADCVVVVSGSRSGHTLNHARRLLLEALHQLGDLADSLEIDLALQPMDPMFARNWTFLNSLDAAIDILALVDHPRLKLAFDLYHLWQEPDLLELLPGLVPLISIVQLSDWNDPPRSLNDRRLPGDGVIPLKPILESLLANGYTGDFDMQVWSTELWQSDYRRLLADCRGCFDELLSETAPTLH